MLLTWPLISQYLWVSTTTARRWARVEGLPIAYRPDGRTFTSKSLIDQWILVRVRQRRELLLAGKDNQRVAADTSKAEIDGG